jgi:hypothetical protein
MLFTKPGAFRPAPARNPESRPPARAMLLRSCVALAAILPMAAAMSLLASAPEASAATAAMSCTQDNDCHSAAQDVTGHNNGLEGDIYFTCLASPTSSDWVTNEVWDITGTGAYWVEAGVIDGYGPPNSSGTHSRAWFWADNRPSESFSVHFPGLSIAHRSTVYPVSISYYSPQTWSIWGGDKYVSMGLSTSQPNHTVAEEAGTEFSDADHLRMSGNISNLLFANSHNDWHNWGSHGKAEKPEGPRNHVKPAYSRSRSMVSWSDC